MYLILFFIFIHTLELLLNNYIKSKVSIKSEENELLELRIKKDKTYEDQLRYIELNSKYKRYISINFTDIIKLLLLVTLVSIFPQFTIWIFAIFFMFNLVKILIARTHIVLYIAQLILNYVFLFTFFRLINQYNIFIVLLISFAASFIFNITKYKVRKK